MTAQPFMVPSQTARRQVRVRSIHRALRCCGAALGFFLTASRTSAAEQDTCLTFRANQVVLDPDDQRVELDGNVEARCGRYELRGERIVLQKAADELCLQGPASLVLCPCQRAPIAIDFERAELSSGELTLDEPSLRVGKSTVFWLPWFWLRAPDRVGALPPKLAWRGDGGLLLGPGVRVPWTASSGSLSWIDLYVSGYSRGGFELEPTIVTPDSSTTARFDRMDGDLLRIRSHGATKTASDGGIAWRADLSRGSRARSGLVDVREAAVAFDHANGFVDLRPWRSVFVRSGMVVSGVRGGERLALGPALFADAGGTLGAGTAWEAGSGFRMLDEVEGTSQLAYSYGRLLVGRWWGPFRFALDAQSTAHAASAAGHAATELAAWTTTEAGLPLSRRIGNGTHLVEPFARGMLFGGEGEAPGPLTIRPNAVGEGGRWSGIGGVRSSFGPSGEEERARVELAVGRVGALSDASSSNAVVGRVAIRTDAFGLEAEASGVSDAGETGRELVARGTAGRPDTVGASVEVASRSRLDPLDARALRPAGSTWAPVGALSQEGTSVFLGGHIPLGGGVGLGANSDWDAGQGRWLAAGSGLMLEHPCGCLRGRAWVSRRIGRPGTDGWVTVELR